MRKEIRVPVLGLVIIAVAIGALLLVGQFLPLILNRDSSSPNKDGLYLSGTETIKVVSPSGSLVSQWIGPDPLSNIAINALAACIPGTNGGSTDPVGPSAINGGGAGSCSSFINAIAIVVVPENTASNCPGNAVSETLNTYSVEGCESLTSATNYLTPLGCNPNEITLGGHLCSGWITQATFGPGTITATTCDTGLGLGCSIVEVDAGTMTSMSPYPTGGGNSEGFDYLNPTPIAVAAGDSILVTIQFTVS